MVKLHGFSELIANKGDLVVWWKINMGPLEPTKYGEQFHELYINCLDSR